ncbi:uncharacterized protein [Oscarella lobularis]
MPPINSSDNCVKDQARALVTPDELHECPLVTIVGPFYRGGDDETINSVVYGNDQLLGLYKKLAGRLGNGVFSLVDEPIDSQYEHELIYNKIVFMQASCDLQATAAVDVLLFASWERVIVVVSSDECGKANKRAFEREIDTRKLGDRPIVEYYVDRSTNALGKRHLSDCRNHSSALSLSDLWSRCLDEPDSPRAIVVLSSVSFALDFFDNGYFASETEDRASFSFLLGDFWGNPARVDDLYDVIMRVTETAETVIALTTVTNGLDKFQEHMTSIRANSAELQRNSILANYWENFFKCSLSRGTCDNTASLPNVNRPILRNYKASLVIDSVFLLYDYLRDNFDWSSVTFDTQNFLRNGISLTTDVSSWTGNRVRINIGRTLPQPAFWSYEILAWTRENGRNYSFPYSKWIFEFSGDDEFMTNVTGYLFFSNDSSNDCSIFDVLPAIATPLVVLLLHVVVFTLSVRHFRLASTRECIVLTPTIFFGLLTLASIFLSILVAVEVLSPFECKTLALDFVINVLSVFCLAPFFVGSLGHLVGGIINRLQIRLLLVAVLIIFEIVLASIASFFHLPDDNYRLYDHCANARNQILSKISYLINAGLALACVIVIWITYEKGYPSLLKNRSTVECGVATFLAIFYIVSISIFLSVNNCRIQTPWLVVLAAFPGFMTWYICTFTAWRRHSVSKRRKLLSVEISESHLSGEPSQPKAEKLDTSIGTVSLIYWEEDIIKEIAGVVISPSRIEQKDRIGKGNFGEVFKGFMDTNVRVALKSVKDAMSRKELNDFVQEGLKMREFKHPNVMELYGICWSDDPTHPNHRSPFLILPYMELGDLKMFLRMRRPGNKSAEERPQHLSLVQLVKFCHQIAKGMNYISDKKLVHRDLAARNCMVNMDLEVKVADFGLSRVMTEGKDYYRTGQSGQLPIRWMSPESLLDLVFTMKSDVWSYGITIWEVMTLAMVPYPGVSSYEVVRFLKAGKRLDKPDECPSEMYHIMLNCWSAEPEDRLPFSQIVNTLEVYMTELMNYFDPTENGGEEYDPYAHWSLTAKGYTEEEEATFEKTGGGENENDDKPGIAEDEIFV